MGDEMTIRSTKQADQIQHDRKRLEIFFSDHNKPGRPQQIPPGCLTCDRLLMPGQARLLDTGEKPETAEELAHWRCQVCKRLVTPCAFRKSSEEREK